jgi:hypothetical protein
VAAWPALPDHIRAAIRALVGTVAPAPFAGRDSYSIESSE